VATSAAPTPQSTAGLLGSRSATLDALRAELALRPVSVQVPGVSAAAPVEAHTTDPVSGGFDLPKGAAVVAWWASGSAPGGPGSVVLAGHVSYDGQTGPFTRLDSVPAGSEVVVTSADGSTHRYLVQSVRSAPKTALDRAELFRTDGPPALVLVTCGGAYDRATHSFASNIVLTATPA
jgi:sortase (surface protein transpeptidase)